MDAEVNKMNADHIVDSFVGKFVSHWSSGTDVSFNLNAVNGSAKIVLELVLSKYQSQTGKPCEFRDSEYHPPSR